MPRSLDCSACRKSCPLAGASSFREATYREQLQTGASFRVKQNPVASYIGSLHIPRYCISLPEWIGQKLQPRFLCTTQMATKPKKVTEVHAFDKYGILQGKTTTTTLNHQNANALFEALWAEWRTKPCNIHGHFRVPVNVHKN